MSAAENGDAICMRTRFGVFSYLLDVPLLGPIRDPPSPINKRTLVNQKRKERHRSGLGIPPPFYFLAAHVTLGLKCIEFVNGCHKNRLKTQKRAPQGRSEYGRGRGMGRICA